MSTFEFLKDEQRPFPRLRHFNEAILGFFDEFKLRLDADLLFEGEAHGDRSA